MTPKSWRASLVVVLFGTVVAIVVGWLALGGRQASADDAASRSMSAITATMTTPQQAARRSTSHVTIGESRQIVHRVSVYFDVESDARRLRVALVSPSGTEVMITDGATARRLEAVFGEDALAPAQSFAALQGEPASGVWTLRLDSEEEHRLVSWRLDLEAMNDSGLLGMSSICEYCSSNGGCGCDVAAPSGRHPLSLLLLAAMLWCVVRRQR